GREKPAPIRPATFRCTCVSDGAAEHRHRSVRIQFRNARSHPYLARDLRDTPGPLSLPLSLQLASRKKSAPHGVSQRGRLAADSPFVPPANAPSAAEPRSRISPQRFESPREMHTSPSPSQT